MQCIYMDVYKLCIHMDLICAAMLVNILQTKQYLKIGRKLEPFYFYLLLFPTIAVFLFVVLLK